MPKGVFPSDETLKKISEGGKRWYADKDNYNKWIEKTRAATKAYHERKRLEKLKEMPPMLEIINENRISAEKIFKDLNDDEKFYLMELIAEERPEESLKAVTEAIHRELVRDKKIKEI